jgi:hypothetical protein
MKTLSYQTFLSFYNENKNKLFMPVSGNRSINEEHVNMWYDNIEKYSPENVRDVYLAFAKTYIEILLYVDFDTFLTGTKEIAQDINILLENHTQYDKIYFYIPEEVTKSNFWITLLVFHYFNNLAFHSRSRSKSPRSRSKSPRSRSKSPRSRSKSPYSRSRSSSRETSLKNKIQFTYDFNYIVESCYNGDSPNKTLCIYCDDMPYTGNQIINNIKIPKKYSPLEKDVIMANLNIIIGCPYISNIAKAKLETMSYVTLCNRSRIINSYIDELKLRYLESDPEMVNQILEMFNYKNPLYALGRNACECSTSYIAIYFDHKLADELSTFKKVILTGSYPVKDEADCRINPLINGYSETEITQALIGYKCNRPYSFDTELDCYTPYYKTIVYTVRTPRRGIINTKKPRRLKVKNISVLALMNAGGRRGTLRRIYCKW